MDLSVKYMGLSLKSPLLASASPLTSKVENIREIEQHGAGAVVLRSLFEEQINDEINTELAPNDMYHWYPEAAELVKSISKPQKAKPYLKLIEEARKTVDIPIIASVNCITDTDWVAFSKQLENAGARALELNISTIITTRPDMDCMSVIDLSSSIVANVKQYVSIPVAVKINPTPSSQIQMVQRLEQAGADAVVLFNRPFQPDINIDTLDVITDNYLSAPEEMFQTLRWVGILSQHVKCNIAASTGIHDHEGVIKQLLAGATVTQLCSTLFINGLSHIATINKNLEQWMEKKSFSTIDQFKGKLLENRLKTLQLERIQFIEKSFG